MDIIEKTSFAHLHVHTDASLRDGLGTVDRLVKAAAEKGFKSLACTDHGTLANAITFTNACAVYGIKPILGLEAYLDGELTGHITLLADGNDGWNNLVKLNNLGHKSQHKHPAITLSQLFDHHENIICLSGCQASPFQQLDFDSAVNLGARFRMVFGSKFFIEMMDVNNFNHAIRAYDLSRALSAKLVITNDVHFSYEEDAPIHKLLTLMKANFTYDDDQLWLKTSNEMSEKFSFLGIKTKWEALERAGKIAEMITPVSFSSKPSLPEIEDADNKLLDLVVSKLKAIKGPKSVERARHEYDIIAKMGYSAYFLILYDLINKTKELDIKVGPGRGSGAGSYILYLLGVTGINPLEFGLPFERFLNEFRVGMPDVDIDFDHEHRHRLIEYAEDKWGAVPIATYSKYSHKSLVHDLANVLKIPSETELELAETSEESEKFVEYCESNPQFSNAYNAIIGQVRHKGKHAGGIVITNKAIPLERTVLKGEIVAAWTEGKTSELSQAGIVKFDLLGLTALSIIRRLEKKVCKTPAYEPGGLEFNLFNIGDLTGIFQFSGSAGIRKYTQDFHPKVLDDLIMINALYRPGTLDVGVADKFLEWKKKPRKIHPLIDPHLESTFGAIVFQEQVMAIVAEVIGGSLGEADEARRLIVKARDMDEKWRKKFNALQSQFLKCAEEKGIDGEHLFEEIKSHARYSFNKAHSAAYAMIAWTMAWWKFNYPTQFYSELINTDPGEAQSYIMSACRHKIKVSVPDINVSTDECVVYKNVMYLPFSIVKSVSPQTACKIADIREREGKFTSAKDFMAKTNKTLRVNSREALYALGSFNSLSDISGKPELAKEILKLRNTSDLTSRNERHLKFMGLIIPTDDLIKLIETLRGDGYLVGIINSIDERISKYGPYQVARLTPSGVFWCRDRDLKVGQTVAVKAKNGKAITLEFL